MKLLSIITFLLFSTLGSAQVFKAGFLAGVSGNQVEGDGYGGYDKIGFLVGGFTNTPIAEKWTAQFEIYFTNKGSFNAAHPDKGDYDMFKFNVNYIEIPLAIQYHYNRFIFEAGPYIAKFLNYSVEDEYGKQEINIYPIKSFDLGGFIGANYKINDHFIFNLRSIGSLVPFRDFENFDQNIGIMNKLFNRGQYHLNIDFTIRYQFGES